MICRKMSHSYIYIMLHIFASDKCAEIKNIYSGVFFVFGQLKK